MWFCSYCKNGNTTNDGNEQELMLDGQDLCKDPAYIRLFEPISADALAGHPRAALTATSPSRPLGRFSQTQPMPRQIWDQARRVRDVRSPRRNFTPSTAS